MRCASTCGPGEVNQMSELPGAGAQRRVVPMLAGCLVGSVSVLQAVTAKQ